MESVSVQNLNKTLEKLRSGPGPNDDGFLPENEILYASAFNQVWIRNASRENDGDDSIDIFDGVRKEFYPMVQVLEGILKELASDISGKPGRDHSGLIGTAFTLAPTYKGAATLNGTPWQLLQVALESLANSQSKKELGHQDSIEKSSLGSEALTQTLTYLRTLKTQISALEKASNILLADGKGNKFDERLQQIQPLLKPPYGSWGSLLSSRLSQVMRWYEDHKANREILSQRHQNELNANKELIEDHGAFSWLKYSFDVFRQDSNKVYCSMDTKYVKRDVGGPAVVHSRLRDDGLHDFVENVGNATIVNGQVQYPEGIQNDDKYRDYINNAFKWTWNNPEQLSCGIKILKYATMQESIRKALLEEGKHEDWRGPRSAAFKKICKCQQNSYAEAMSLRDSLTKLIKYAFSDLQPILHSMDISINDIYCNVQAEDFKSAVLDYQDFSKAYIQLCEWLRLFNSQPQ